MFDTLIKNALVVTPNAPLYINIAVSDGKIAGLFDPQAEVPAKEIFDYSGKIIFPGVIDSHAHVTYCADFSSGSRTAASGGVTTLIEMPQSGHMPSVFTADVLRQRIDAISQTSVVDCALYGGIQANALERAAELAAGGVAAFKVFLSDAGSYGSFDDSDLLELFRVLEPHRTLVAVHAESQPICDAETKKLIAAGKGPECNSESRPVISEVLAVTRLCTLALHAGARISVCHVSSGEVLDVIREFRRRGLRVTAETCPHYLLLTGDDVTRYGAWAKCAPPIRDREHVNALWECLANGDIDMIGSDHATYSDEQKSSGSFWDVPGGFPGLDLILPGLFSEGVCRRRISLNRLAQITASNPAQIFGLSHCKGSIAPGMDADFAVLDPAVKWTFHASESFYDVKSDRYPYEGRELQGKVVGTFVRGKQVYKDGRVLPNQKGRYIPVSR